MGTLSGWLYLAPALAFLIFFMVYPLIDVFIYSFEEGYNSASQTYFGIGGYNYSYVLRDPYFLQAVKNTFILVIFTVPISTILALLISLALNSIEKLKKLFQTIYFLPYVTNTLAVGLVFMILFRKTPYTDGLINMMIKALGMTTVDFIEGPYWAKMLVLCVYVIWIVMPFKILILTSALASVNPVYYKAATEDTRAKGLGPKTVEKIYDQFKEKLGCEFDYHIYNQEDTIKLLCNVIYDVAKINDEEFTRRMLFENIKTNTSLVSLTNESIPEDVITNMGTDIEIENAKNPAILSKITKETIFSKSRFKDYKSSIQMRSNVMKGIKDDGDMSFIKG